LPRSSALPRARAAEAQAGQELRAFLEDLVQLIPTPLVVKDAADGRYVLVNRAAEESWGISRADVLGRSAEELFPPDQARAFAREDDRVIRSRKVHISRDEPITTPKGALRYFTTKKLATYEGETARHLIVIGEDVTEQKEAREALSAAVARAEAATEAKSTFLANLSHEIKTPLSGILGVTNLLGRTALTAEQTELLALIRDSGEALSRMLMDVLDLSKIEAGKIVLAEEPFKLGDLVRSVTGLMRPAAEAKQLQLSCQVAPEAEAHVLGDALRLRQVLTNLLSNAVKFTERGFVRVEVIVLEDGRFSLSVEDTGIGFDETVRSRLFQRFQQADGSIAPRFGGTGLGLAICRELSRLMGGDLDGESTPGRGSRFTALLPLALAADSPPAALETSQQGPLPIRVLAADDHAINRKVAELTLSAAGAEILLACDGAEAVELYSQHRPELVLMDVHMPTLDGIAATRAIRKLEAQNGWPAAMIIMLTGRTFEADVAEALAAGANAHLAKPLQPERLLATVSNLVVERTEPPRA
jgi:PAS domain S-box-containing protein